MNWVDALLKVAGVGIKEEEEKLKKNPPSDEELKQIRIRESLDKIQFLMRKVKESGKAKISDEELKQIRFRNALGKYTSVMQELKESGEAKEEEEEEEEAE